MQRTLLSNIIDVFGPHRKQLLFAIVLALGAFLLGYLVYLFRSQELIAMLEQQGLLQEYTSMLADLRALQFSDQFMFILKDSVLSVFLLLILGIFLSFLPILLLFSQALTMGVLFAHFSVSIDIPSVLIGSFVCILIELIGYAVAASWGQVLGRRTLHLIVSIFARQPLAVAKRFFREDVNTAGFILIFCAMWVTITQTLPLLFGGMGGL